MYRTRMKQELQKQQQELEQQREEEEMKKRREMARIQSSASVDVPSPQTSQGPMVNIDVPPTILEVN